MIDEDLIKFFASSVKDGYYGDIRLSEREGTFLSVENGKVRRAANVKDAGFGLRVIKNGVCGFVSSNNISKKAIKAALDAAYSKIRVDTGKTRGTTPNPELNNVRLDPKWAKDTRSVDIADKLRLTMDMDRAAIGKDTVATVSDYRDLVTHWLIGNNLGAVVSFYESHPQLGIASFVKDGATTHSIKKTLSGNCGFELFDNNANSELGRATKEEAEKLIGAKAARGGKYDVVLDYAMTGVYTHEAFGHASEADAILAKSSVLENKLGKKVGNDIVTIVDDPTIKLASGSFPFDQEGVAAKKRIIVDRGVLKEYLHTLETAETLGLTPNGAARAMDYASIPLSRMSNTFIAPGDFSDDIYEGIKCGISLYGFQYGYVETSSGKFMFKSQYGRMIHNGKLAEYVRDVALTGTTLDILNRIDAITSDFKLDAGVCGKEGQWVPVTSGGPSIRIRGVVVGGQ